MSSPSKCLKKLYSEIVFHSNYLNTVQRYKKYLEYANNLRKKIQTPDIFLWSEQRSPRLLPFEAKSQLASPWQNERSRPAFNAGEIDEDKPGSRDSGNNRSSKAR